MSSRTVYMGGGMGPVQIPDIPGITLLTAAVVAGGTTYNVKTSDSLVKFDTSDGSAAIAVLPSPSYVGEQHAFIWFAWGAGQVPPQIDAGGTNTMTPAMGMQSSGQLVTSTAITQTGMAVTYEWSGTEWVKVSSN